MNRIDPFHARRAATAVLEPPQPKPQAAPVTPAPAATTPTPAPKKKGLNFGGLKQKKEDTKTAYPVFNSPEASLIAARIKTRTQEIEALEGALATDKAELKQSVGLFYFQTNRGKVEVPSSISVPSDEGEVLVTFQNRYSKLPSLDPVVAVLGQDRADEYFRQQDTLTISCDKIAVDQAQPFVDELMQLLARYNASDSVEVKSAITPVKDFHTRRHTVLSIEENMALDGAYPIVAMIKTKGRGEK